MSTGNNNTKEYTLSKKQERLLKIYLSYFDKNHKLKYDIEMPDIVPGYNIYPYLVKSIVETKVYSDPQRVILNNYVRPVIVFHFKKLKIQLSSFQFWYNE